MMTDIQAELDAITLPQSVLALLQEQPSSQEPMSENRLDKISEAFVKIRQQAIDGRRSDEIDKIFTNCEEAYAGIDDANRGHFRGRWKKPMSGEGPVVVDQSGKAKNDNRSTAFIRMTARYVDIGSAKVSEILLPANDKAFSLSATPVPEVVDGQNDVRQLVHDGQPLERDATPEEMARDQQAQAAQTSPLGPPPQGAAPISPMGTAGSPAPPSGGAALPGKPLVMRDLALEKSKKADERAKAAEKRIYDWLIESKYRSQMRRVLFDAARLGVGVLKGPYAKMSRAMKVVTRKEDGTLDVRAIMEKKVSPAVKWVSPWNFFPHPACGEDIQNGDYCWERDLLTRKKLRDLKKQPNYIKKQIDKVIKEGPGKIIVDNPDITNTNPLKLEQYEIWHFNGYLSREDFLAAEQQTDLPAGERAKADELDEDVHVLATMVNDSVIRVVQQPLDSGALTYYAMPWVVRPGCWVGVGVGEQLDVPQRLLNGAVRAMINNAGMTAGSQIAVDKGSIVPADGVWEVTPDKLWLKKDNGNSAIDDIRKAIVSIPLVNVTRQLMTIVELALRFAEESSNIPLVTQGQSGNTQPDTFRGMQLQDNNANQLLRDIAGNCDDHITERLITAYYEWLLIDPDVPDTEKGDFHINAQGSSALVERAIQAQFYASLGAVVKDPAFRLKPDRWAEVMMKSNKVNPTDMQYTDEEWDKIQNQPPPKPYQLQIAELRAQVDMMRAKMDSDRDTIYAQAENEQTKIQLEDNREDRKLKIQLELLKYANMRAISIDDAKKELGITVMKLKVQRELAAEDRAGQALEAPNEPPGKAPTGQGYEK